MDKKITGLIGAATALAFAGPVSATTISPPNPMAVESYSDLLEPIPNALELMKAEDRSTREAQPRVQLADYHHHHHHHHHRYRRVIPRIVIPLLRDREYRHHHHHHHHHHRYYRRYD